MSRSKKTEGPSRITVVPFAALGSREIQAACTLATRPQDESSDDDPEELIGRAFPFQSENDDSYSETGFDFSTFEEPVRGRRQTEVDPEDDQYEEDDREAEITGEHPIACCNPFDLACFGDLDTEELEEEERVERAAA